MLRTEVLCRPGGLSSSNLEGGFPPMMVLDQVVEIPFFPGSLPPARAY